MRRSNFSSSRGGSGGPLMTDHLQDLELELELLKRKRQLIQQQQNDILYRNPVENRLAYGSHVVQPFEHRYNDAPQRNFSHLYNEGPRDNRSFVPKRQAPDWAGPSGDRFGAHSSFKRPRQGPNPSNSRFNESPNPRPLMSQPRPLLSAPQNRRPPPVSLNVPPKRPAVRPNQSAFKRRPKPNPPSPKVAPNAQRPYYGTPKETPVVYESRKPVSDVEPAHKVNGRLELALGNIVKRIKETRPEAAALFHSPTLARLMKKGIRERVRSAMAGKVVGTVPSIVEEYRKMYPPATDADILDLAKIKTQKLNENAELAIELFEEGDPEQYFKKNMKRLLEVKLDEMFKKAEQRNAEEIAISEAEILAHLPNIKKSHENMTFTDNRKSEEDMNKQDKDQAEIENNAEETKMDKNAEETEKNGEGTEKNAQDKEKSDAPVLLKNEEYEKWLSMLIGRMLPRVLPRFKEFIIKLLDVDRMYCTTKAAIITHSSNAALTLAMNQDPGAAGPGAGDPVLPTHLPYFVKVLAVPAMPRRKLMEEFLHSFNSKTIKRHKKNKNLLFVGFSNKEDYDKILQANQSKIGSATLTIVSAQNSKSALLDNTFQNEGTNGTAGQSKTEDQSEDILTPQLDDQINDLLSSIRQADEEAKGSGETEAVDDNANDDVEMVEPKNGNGQTEVEKDSDVEEVKSSDADVIMVEDDEVAPLMSEESKEVKGTPAKGKAPATPSTIRTRRASRLAQNN